MHKLIALILFMTSFSALAFDSGSPWGNLLMSTVFKQGFGNHFSDAHALKMPWQLDREFVDGRERSPDQSRPVQLKCDKNKLWPTHPQQTTKDYLFAVFSQYDHGKLKADSYPCRTPNPTRRFCLRGDVAKVVVMSDVYEDECGNVYRGYWLMTFQKSDENQGTLSARGRTFYIDQNGSNFRLGHTYPVNKSEFLFLGGLLPGDLAKAKQGRDEALRLGMKIKGRAYIPKN